MPSFGIGEVRKSSTHRTERIFKVTGIDGKHNIRKMHDILKEKGLCSVSLTTCLSRSKSPVRYPTHDSIFLSEREKRKGVSWKDSIHRYDGELHDHLNGVSLTVNQWSNVPEVNWDRWELSARFRMIGGDIKDAEEVLFAKKPERAPLQLSNFTDNEKKGVDCMLILRIPQNDIANSCLVHASTIRNYWKRGPTGHLDYNRPAREGR